MLFAEALHSYMRKGTPLSSSAKNLMKLVDHGTHAEPVQMQAEAAGQHALFAGNLECQLGHSKKWLNVWCAVVPDGLIYMYQNDKASTADQILPLERAQVIDVCQVDMEHPLCVNVEFAAQNSQMVGITFRADNMSHKREFLESLRRGKIEASKHHSIDFLDTHS